MKKIINLMYHWYTQKNRWYVPLVSGLIFAFALPPFNHEAHWLFFGFPLLSFLMLVPMMAFALQKTAKRAVLHVYLFGISASLSQFYWISNVGVEGLKHLILLGLAFTTAVVALYYLGIGMLFRLIYKHFPRFYLVLFPAAWVLIEYFRTIGDLAFPWMNLGYVFVPITPLAQLASVGGVYLLSFMVVLGNILIFELIRSYLHSHVIAQKWLHMAVFFFALFMVYIWGMFQIQSHDTNKVRVSAMQINMDQTKWGNNSLDSSLEAIENMVLARADDSLDLIVLPESAIYCYLLKHHHVRLRVASWADTVGVPIIAGSLHWEYSQDTTKKYDVYNTAYMISGDPSRFVPYYKMQLVPGSESIPFKSQFPILSRLNIGSADFSKGTQPVVFNAGRGIKAAPFICYEMIFPALVRKRVQEGANLLVNVTNDGWFGKSTAPHQHAMMARMRSIENGVSQIRAANSGISLAADQYGRELGRTGLYTRDELVVSIPIARVDTLYTKLGDWVIWLSMVLLAVATAIRLRLAIGTKSA